MAYRAVRSARDMALALGLMFALASPAHADTRDVFEKGFDAVVLRPVGAVRTLVGAVLFVPTSLFSLPAGIDHAREGFDVLVKTPARYTFQRPLGDL